MSYCTVISNFKSFRATLINAFCSALLILLMGAIQVTAAPTASDQTKKTDSQPEPVIEIFDYVLDNRSDPFVPFISEKAASTKTLVDMNEIVENNNPLSGMQLFEPGQLTLVALMQKGIEDIAMVEDFTGKGYILTEGTKIGRRGVVRNIASNNVIIEETAVTRAGKKIITEVVMILKKEGEE